MRARTFRTHTPDGPAMSFETLVRATCPFCRHERTWSAGYKDGDKDTGDPMLIHDEPPCREFLERSVTDFMQTARMAGARTLPKKEALS